MNKKKKQLYLIVGAVVLLLMLAGGEEKKSTLAVWNDRMMPGIELKCLNAVSNTETTLLAKQRYCQCVAKTFKKSWKAGAEFQEQLESAVSRYFYIEDHAKKKQRDESVRLVESDLDPFLREILLRLGMKWSGPAYVKVQGEIDALLQPLMDVALRSCLKPGSK